jgi:hypothetical protein
MNTRFATTVAMLTLALVGILALVPRVAQAADPAPARRIAVIVGANDPSPGRTPLKYAQSDALLMADVLVRVGRFAKSDVQVLLEPRPAEVLAALDTAARTLAAAGPSSMLVFYYSGHSDGQQVFPHGDALTLSDLRDRLGRSTAGVRIAILDTCRGGGWTRTKGLSVGPPLDAIDLMNVATEGTALLSSSSGLENAHEAGAVHGSFFTHHVAAGLLGAADKSGDGNVTLQEVFEYAKERTVRDSARMATTTQHPSFDLQLRGRQDIVLAQVASSASALEVSQNDALEVIHLASGVTVLETPPGRQQLRLALVPGRYVVRRVANGRVMSKEVEVRAGATVTLSEAQLELTGSETLASKNDADTTPFSAHSTLLKHYGEIRLALGVSTGEQHIGSSLYVSGGQKVGPLSRDFAALGALTYGITDRLTWAVPVPAFAYRLGTEGAFEVIPRAGLSSIGYGSIDGFMATLDGGVTTRAWLTPRLSLVSHAFASWQWRPNPAPPSTASRLLDLGASGGLVWNVDDRVTLGFGVGWSGTARVATLPPGVATASQIDVGAVQSLGYRPIPLVQLHLTRGLSLDGYASVSVDLRDGSIRDRYLGGFTLDF